MIIVAMNANNEDYQKRYMHNTNIDNDTDDLSEWNRLTAMFDSEQMLVSNIGSAQPLSSATSQQHPYTDSLSASNPQGSEFQRKKEDDEVTCMYTQSATAHAQSHFESQSIALQQQVKRNSFSKLMMIEASSFADLLRCNQLFYQNLECQEKPGECLGQDLKPTSSKKSLVYRSRTTSFRNLTLPLPDSLSMSHRANATWPTFDLSSLQSLSTSTMSSAYCTGRNVYGANDLRMSNNQYTLQESTETTHIPFSSLRQGLVSLTNQEGLIHSRSISSFTVEPISIRPDQSVSKRRNSFATTICNDSSDCDVKRGEQLLSTRKKLKTTYDETESVPINTTPAERTNTEGAILANIGRRIFTNESDYSNSVNTQQGALLSEEQQMQDWLKELYESMIPPYQLHKSKKLLLKPLSPYNYFYRDERDNIVQSISNENDPLPEPLCDFSVSKMQVLLYQHWYIDPMKKKRAHRKAHGKMNFEQLSRVIAERWHSLPNNGREFYRTIARYDDKFYHEQLEIYNTIFGNSESK